MREADRVEIRTLVHRWEYIQTKLGNRMVPFPKGRGSGAVDERYEADTVVRGQYVSTALQIFCVYRLE